MTIRVLPLLLPLLAQTSIQQVPPTPPTPVVRQAPPIYSDADPRPLLARALELADVDDIRVLINWGTNDDRGRRFANALRSPEVMKTRYAADEYHVVNINVGELDRNLDLAKQYGARLTADALPALTVLDERGKVLAQATSKDFESGIDPAAFDPAKIAAFFTKHQAPAPDAVAPFEAAVKRAKTEGKVVFVWWSAPW